MGKWIVLTGVALVVIGLLVLGLERLGLGPGRLPGDIAIERNGFAAYIPITSMLLLSLLLTGFSLLAGWLRK